jgi:Integrase core domain
VGRLGIDNRDRFLYRLADQLRCRTGWLDFSRPGKPTDNAFSGSFNGKFRAECLNAHWFMSLDDARRRTGQPERIMSGWPGRAMMLSSSGNGGQGRRRVGLEIQAPALTGPLWHWVPKLRERRRRPAAFLAAEPAQAS